MLLTFKKPRSLSKLKNKAKPYTDKVFNVQPSPLLRHLRAFHYSLDALSSIMRRAGESRRPKGKFCLARTSQLTACEILQNQNHFPISFLWNNGPDVPPFFLYFSKSANADRSWHNGQGLFVWPRKGVLKTHFSNTGWLSKRRGQMGRKGFQSSVKSGRSNSNGEGGERFSFYMQMFFNFWQHWD